jgi:hypothetical protein
MCFPISVHSQISLMHTLYSKLQVMFSLVVDILRATVYLLEVPSMDRDLVQLRVFRVLSVRSWVSSP